LAKAQGSGDLTEAPAAVIGTISQENLFPRACTSLFLIERDRAVRDVKAERPFG
jgi:hypothetical protein